MANGQQKGAENVAKLNTYLDSIDAIPAKAGKVNITAIAEACGMSRSAMYQNKKCKQIITDAVAAKGLKGVEERTTEADPAQMILEGKVNRLEQKCASQTSEIFELRRQLNKLKHLEMLYEQGKRAIL